MGVRVGVEVGKFVGVGASGVESAGVICSDETPQAASAEEKKAKRSNFVAGPAILLGFLSVRRSEPALPNCCLQILSSVTLVLPS